MEESKIWLEILTLQLNGVMYHVALFEQFKKHNLLGFAQYHKHHAEEEFKKYLHIYGDIIENYKISPETSEVKLPPLELDGTTAVEKIENGLDVYENWEKTVYSSLQNYKADLQETKEHIDHLFCSVKEELKYINCMKNDVLDGKAEELDCWLKKIGE